MMRINPNKVRPSQGFLKPETIRYIFDCIRTGDIEKLPPRPIVRKNDAGELIAIDGHNLLAVKSFLHEDLDVHLASSADDGLAPTDEANRKRNSDLLTLFDEVVKMQQELSAKGITSFKELTARYEGLFKELT